MFLNVEVIRENQVECEVSFSLCNSVSRYVTDYVLVSK
jgi:hypothetical protein